jgi:hypothetical protein
MVPAARAFYAQVKRIFPRLSDLTREIDPIMASNQLWQENLRRVVAKARADCLNPRDFGAVVGAAGTPKMPAKFRPLIELAHAILPYTAGAVKDIAPERGPKGGQKGDGWRGSITVSISAAGMCAGSLNAKANHTRTVEIELLAPERLTVLYATGPRGGPAEAAKTMVAEILGRSRATMEAMVSQARSAENADTSIN